MPLPKQKLREIVFLLLFSRDQNNSDLESMIPLLKKELKVSRAAIEEANSRLNLFWDNLDKTDALITKHSTSYDFVRIPAVEKNVLRLALFEMFDDKEIPPLVAISEGMRLAKKFGTAEAAKFVNAILDAIYQESQP